MKANWLRRGLWAAAAGAVLALAGCGSGTIESQFVPNRVVAFGDAMADLGQTGPRYTISDATINIWTQQVSTNFGYNIGTVNVPGGTSYATAHARVVAKPSAAGSNTTPTVEEQIGTFLGRSTFTASDLVLVSAGTSDIIAEAAKVIAGTQTSTAAVENAKAAGRALAGQVRRIVNSGATHVVVAGVYNMAKSPWALQTNQGALLQDLSMRFNDELLVAMVDLGANVLYVDAALEYNLFAGFPGTYSFANVTDPACTSVDPGVGIGTGTGQVNSSLCSTSTLVSGASSTNYLWADRVYPSGAAHRFFGDYAYSRIRQRW
ncbi:SGNH/GDSL hydrolase family protein [Ramlibacter albus]|uniref:SGNH/GDSL hydrolase family protein n=1 Tax=Ramlibacter albus TaxID=2079448 RepID=A0A923S3Y8_9BURK|nr:SGNH/GDSL hydrolase family protein [Ramlibacter albus]MBC5763582.1 SGNH/GDSL hydrolase family protein [Ramlibacter albus]